MAAPVFVASYSSVYTNNNMAKSVSVTTQAGDVVVVYAGSENGTTNFNTPSGNSISFTLNQAVHVNSSWADAYIWSGTDTAGGTNWTLNVNNVGTAILWGLTCLVFRNSSGIGASTSINTTASGSASVSLTTTQANSAVVVAATDWNINSGSTRTWKTVNSITPSSGNGMETTFVNNAQYLAYGAYYSDVGTVGSKTIGYDTGQSQKYSMVALEVKGTITTVKVHTLTDNFDDNSIDNTKWTTGSSGSGSSIAETGGRLVVTLPTSPNTGYSFVDSDTLDLTGSSVTVEAPVRPAATNGTEQAVQLRSDANNYIGFTLYPTLIEMSYTLAGSANATTIARDDYTQRWFRIREAGGITYWETSPDRSTWTVQRGEAIGFDISAIKVRLHGGTWQAVASPGTAAFDNFNFESPTFRNTAEGQADGTTLTAGNSGGGSGDAFSTVTVTGSLAVTYSTDMSMFGTQSYKVVPNTSTALYIRPSVSGAYCGACQMYLYLPTYANNNQQFLGIYNSASAYSAQWSIDATGIIRIAGTGAGNIHISAPGTIPTGQWTRLDLAVQVGSNTSNGRVIAQASLQNSFTPFWSYDSGFTANTGTSTISEYRLGKLDTTPYIPLLYMDNLAWRSNMVDFIPPESSSPGVGWFTA